MTGKLNTWKTDFLLAVFCIVFSLTICVQTVAAAGVDTSDSARAYCVNHGYLYRTVPSLNNDQGICEFPDKTWCDANAFYTGKCTANPYRSYNPYFYNINPQSGLTPAEASNMCRNSGGKVENVHTPYGDVDLCVFPDSRAVDLRELYSGALRDNWYYYAYSWLNAP